MSAIILRFILYCLLFCQSHTFCMSSFRLTLTIADRFVTKKATHLCAAFSINNRGTRNRTQLWSFGDSYSTDELCPYKQVFFALTRLSYLVLTFLSSIFYSLKPFLQMSSGIANLISTFFTK